MCRRCPWLLTAALLAFPIFAGAQPPPPPGFGPGKPPMGPPPLQFLFSQRSVQVELKLTTPQLRTVNQVVYKQMAEMKKLFGQPPDQVFPKMEELNKASDQELRNMLKTDQAKRLDQILLQQQAVKAFTEPKVVDELTLTTEQQQKIRDIQEAGDKEVGKLFQGRPVHPELVRRKMVEVTNSGMVKVTKLLTKEQKKKWKALTGKAFTVPIPLGPPPGMPGRPPGASSRLEARPDSFWLPRAFVAA
jgi:hypothetical protein